MIVKTFENKDLGLKSHVSMMLLNKKAHYTVDIFDTVEKHFLDDDVKVFVDKADAVSTARSAIATVEVTI